MKKVILKKVTSLRGTRKAHIGSTVNYNPAQDATVNLLASGRSGLTMPVAIGSPVQILTPTFRGVSGVSTALTGTVGELERIFDGNDHTFYFKTKVLNSVVGFQQLVKCGNYANLDRGFILFTDGALLYIDAADGSHSTEGLISSQLNTVCLDIWIELIIKINFTTKILSVNMYRMSDGVEIGRVVNLNISTFDFNANNNAGPLVLGYITPSFAYCDVKKFGGLKTIEQCRDNTYITDLKFYYPTLIDGIDVSANAHHLTRSGITYANNYYSDVSTYHLDKGFSIYTTERKYTTANSEDVYAPYSLSGNPITAVIKNTYSEDYVKSEDHPGSLTRHNFAASRLNIPTASFDKASTIIFENAVRTSIHYNAANTDEWHISEFDYLIFSQNCKTSHKATNFFKVADNSLIGKKYLDQIFSLTADAPTKVTSILNYTGDGAALRAALNMYEDTTKGTYVFSSFYLTGKSGTSRCEVYWGDATKATPLVMDDISHEMRHTLAGSGIYPIYVFYPENISDLRTGNNSWFVPVNNLVSEFGKLVSTTFLSFWGSLVSLVGSANSLNKDITTLVLDAKTATGDVTPFTKLKKLAGYNAYTGSMANAIDLEYVDVCWFGDSAIEVDVTNTPNITAIDVQDQPRFRLIGDLSGKTKFKQLCYGGVQYNALTGSLVASASTLEYWANSGDTTCGADIAIFLNLYLFQSFNCLNTFSGSINGLTLLQAFCVYNSQNNITKQTRFNNHTKLSYFRNDQWSYSAAEMNQVLADFVTTKDNNKPYALREIWLTGTPPTGQGITDLAFLRGYRSPNNDPAKPVWTIYINGVSV